MNDDVYSGDSAVGGAIGARIANRVVDAVIAAKARSGGLSNSVAQTVARDFTNHVSDEVRSVMGPLWRQMAQDPDVPAEIRPLLHALGNLRGQAWAWIGGTATGAALGGGLMNLLTNLLNPVILPMIAAAPHGIVTPDQAAAAQARGLTRGWNPRQDANSAGIDDDRYNALVAMAEALPTVDELRVLLNRGAITVTQFADALRRYGYAPEWNSDLIGLSFVDASGPELAAMWNRNLVTRDEAVGRAQRVGIPPNYMDELIDLGGEPPPLDAAILAWRRGIIDESKVDRAIIQGPIRNEWIEVMKALQEQPLTPDEAASAVTQGHMTVEKGQQTARLSGINPDDFRILVENSGIPPGIEFAAEAFNRGLLDDAGWEAMFLESRIKNRYIPLMRLMRQNLIPTETTRLLYRHGVYPLDAAIETLRGHGFSDTDARAMLALEDVRAREGTKDLSVTQVVELYSDDLITRDQANGMLTGVGYDDQEATWRLDLAEVDKMRRFVNAAVSRVRSSYVANAIGEQEAVALLDEIGVPFVHRDRLIQLWNLERETVSAQLTTAQIQSALKKGLIDAGQAYQRLLGRHYSPEDAEIIIRLTGVDVPEQGG